jgi:hypothetical protein
MYNGIIAADKRGIELHRELDQGALSPVHGDGGIVPGKITDIIIVVVLGKAGGIVHLVAGCHKTAYRRYQHGNERY